MRRFLYSGATLVALILVICVGVYIVINARTFQLAGRLVARVPTDEKVVALTLDDGPSEHTPEVLQTLARLKVPATFYLNGKDLQRFPQHGAAIAAAGHEIGNHTFSHDRLVFASDETVADEVEKTDEEIRATGYTGDITFRPPYGKKLWVLPAYLDRHNITTVMWDVEPDSSDQPDTAAIVQQTLESTQPGSIILLHVMFDGREASRAALPGIVSGLRDRGYQFVTVSELLRHEN
jgi:peptidoglycan/xylan/chitin deacetylase (PgdA/CDA1 family)